MTDAATVNRTRLKIIAQALAGLNQDVVFVGGATIALYVDSPIAAIIRPTNDVDVVVELASYASYSALDSQLRALGFQNDTTSNVICRYWFDELVVDIMPTEADAIGFSNRWYAEGFQTAMEYTLDEQTSIRLFTLPYFLASKWEACKGRGGDDLRWSTDFEDIVFILDQIPDIEAQLHQAPSHIQAYFRLEFDQLLRHPNVDECIYAHLEPRFASIRLNRIRQILSDFTNNL
jgi:predicted nucleotidyltransferase